MLCRISLYNFMSYDHVTLDLPVGHLMLVGDNGSGKSALVEAIPFGYFGIGRGPVAALVRDGCKGMSVTLDHVDFPKKGDVTTVYRGRDPTGRGVIALTINGMAQSGSAVEVNQKIVELLGMNVEQYLSTSFFGMSDTKKSDLLMNVSPADRWETVQSLFGVAFYQKALGGVARRVSVKKSELDTLDGEVKVIRALIVDGKSIFDEWTDTCKALADAEGQKVLHEGDVKEWSEKAKGYTQTMQRMERVRDSLTLHDNWVKTLSTSVEQKTGKVEALQQKCDVGDMTVEQIDEVLSETMESQKKSSGELGQVEARFGLLNTALVLGGGGSDDVPCPLCDAPLLRKTLERWEVELGQYQSKASLLRKQMAGLQHKIALLNQQKVAQAEAVQVRERIRDVVSAMSTDQKQLNKHVADLAKAKEAMKALKESVSKDDREAADMDEYVQNALKQTMHRMGELKAKVKELEGKQDTQTDYRKQLATLEKRRAKVAKDVAMFAYLTAAFSRYGIPAQLVQEGLVAIQELATKTYEKFDPSAEILVETVTEGAKPSVEFILSDDRGKRPYEMLSKGEKVMVFLSVRIAVSRIISEMTHSKVDVLILDEVLGNLSASNREALLTVALKVVKSMFPRIVMVSHVDIPDVFTTVEVECIQGVSHLKV